MDLRARTRRALALALGVWAALLIGSPLAAQSDEAAPEQASESAAGQAAAGAEEAGGDEIPTGSLTGPIGLLVHPVYPPEQARLVYQPLVDYLNQATDLTI